MDCGPEPGTIHTRPLREVNTRSSGHITGIVCSETMRGEWIVREGANERAFLTLAELDPRIEAIHAQPMLVEYVDDRGIARQAWPDFAILIDGSWEIHEVKPDDQYARPAVRRTLQLVAKAVNGYGHRYSVTLGNELHRRCKAGAVDEAWRRLKRRVHPLLERSILDALRAGPMTIGQLLAKLSVLHPQPADLHALLAQKRIRADMTRRADDDLLVHSASSDTWFPRLIPFNDPLEADR